MQYREAVKEQWVKPMNLMGNLSGNMLLPSGEIMPILPNFSVTYDNLQVAKTNIIDVLSSYFSLKTSSEAKPTHRIVQSTSFE